MFVFSAVCSEFRILCLLLFLRKCFDLYIRIPFKSCASITVGYNSWSIRPHQNDLSLTPRKNVRRESCHKIARLHKISRQKPRNAFAAVKFNGKQYSKRNKLIRRSKVSTIYCSARIYYCRHINGAIKKIFVLHLLR